MDHFERLGLPRRFQLDVEALDREYLSRSRELHPDYFHLGSDSERHASIAISAALNESYSTLKDPFKRADYLLKLEAGPSASEIKEMPLDFLEEVLELRMAIAEIQPDSAEAKKLQDDLKKRREGFLGQFAKLLDSVNPPNRESVLKEARKILNATKYVQGLINDLRNL